MCDRAMLINDKKIEIIGNPHDVITKFKSLFVNKKD
jgi:ABC-type polysaccharide/polyol phosphate transport system ATPase subunit